MEKAILQSPVVLVVGSLHYDIMVASPGLPQWDETLQGQSWQPKFGGKGGNQAVAVTRAGVPCRMLGAVGNDAFAPFLRDGLRARGVDDRFVATVPGVASGMSVALCGPTGDYAAVIVSGANLAIDPSQLDNPALWNGVQVLLLQNEVAPALNLAAAHAARARGLRIVLNAAPAREMHVDIGAVLDVLIINAVEAAMMGADPVVDLQSAAIAARCLGQKYRSVVVTAGEHGLASFSSLGQEFSIPAQKVIVQSSHGAGDMFTGTMVAALARGDDLYKACQIASAAAAAHVAGA